MGGVSTPDQLYNLLLSLLIHFADKVVASFMSDREGVDAIDCAHNDIARFAGGLNGHVQHGMHVGTSAPKDSQVAMDNGCCARATGRYEVRSREMLTNIRIVLVETSHPGNIGAAARAMKTMGLNALHLVNPKTFPDAQATAMASGADDILAHTQVWNNLPDALQGCARVFGCTARNRSLAWPAVTPREAAEVAGQVAGAHGVAFVFGREQSGLANDELALCNHAVHIPANADYSSLNLAAAVQVIAYELFVHHAEPGKRAKSTDVRWVDAADLEGFYQHFAEALTHVGFFDVGNPRIVMRRLRRLFSRTRLDENEHNILRGFFRAVLAMKKAGDA